MTLVQISVCEGTKQTTICFCNREIRDISAISNMVFPVPAIYFKAVTQRGMDIK